MSASAVTLADVIAYHVRKTEDYTARASTWAQSAEQLKADIGRPNAVRRDRLDACAQQAADIAVHHAAMADLLEDLAARQAKRWPRLLGWTVAAALSLALWQAATLGARSLTERSS